MNNLKEQLQEDIISYFEGYLEPPFTYTSEDKETMVDDLCELVCRRLSTNAIPMMNLMSICILMSVGTGTILLLTQPRM
jgi:hypothetical protein